MTDDVYPSGGRNPSAAGSATSAAAGRLALKRATLSVGAAIVGAYGLGAVLTYSPEDPSLNTASDGATHNLFGGPGATFADLIIQTFGAAAPLAMGALFAAGAMRIGRKQLVAPIHPRRVLVSIAGTLLLGAAASTIPTPEGWPLATGFGGMIGDGVSNFISGILSGPGLPMPRIITGVLCAIGGLLAVGWSFQIRAEDVKQAAGAARRAASVTAGGAQRAIGYVQERTRRPDAEEETPRLAVEDRRERAPAPRPAPRAQRPLPQTRSETDAFAPKKR